MHIALAPFDLKPGVTEDALLDASDAFDREFASHQDGIIRRTLVKDSESGRYADIVLFRDLESIENVMQAEQDSEACAAFYSIMDSDGTHHVYEVLKAYEQ